MGGGLIFVTMELSLTPLKIHDTPSLPFPLNSSSIFPKLTGFRKVVTIQIVFLFFVIVDNRHGDRTRAEAAPCWANDTAVWDCLLTSASLPVIKHDIHDITVDRIYRDGRYFSYCILYFVHMSNPNFFNVINFHCNSLSADL